MTGIIKSYDSTILLPRLDEELAGVLHYLSGMSATSKFTVLSCFSYVISVFVNCFTVLLAKA